MGKKLHFHQRVVFFPTSNIYTTLYFKLSSTLLRKNRNTDFLYMYIYIYIYKIVPSISLSRPHKHKYILITNEDRKQFPFNPPIFRSHSVIFFRVTN